MTAFRLISFSTHAVIEFVGGLALMLAPFALGLTGSGLVIPFVLGALAVGASLGATESLPVSAHFAWDNLFVAAGLAFALGLSLTGDDTAATVVLIAAAGQLVLTLITRYSRSAPAPRL